VFATTDTPRLLQEALVTLVLLDMNAVPKMRTSRLCLVLRASSHLQLQQTVPFVPPVMRAKLRVMWDKCVLLVLFLSLVTDFALFALPDSSVLTRQQVLSYAKKAIIKIRWAQQTVPFALLVIFAKTALKFQLFAPKDTTPPDLLPIAHFAIQDFCATHRRQTLVRLAAFAPVVVTVQLLAFLFLAQREHTATSLVLHLS